METPWLVGWPGWAEVPRVWNVRGPAFSKLVKLLDKSVQAVYNVKF